MRRIPVFGVLAVLAATAGAIMIDIPAADARSGNARWCAAVTFGPGEMEETCEFATLEACRPFVIAGNRGFCNENPDFVDRSARHARPKRHIKR